MPVRYRVLPKKVGTSKFFPSLFFFQHFLSWRICTTRLSLYSLPQAGLFLWLGDNCVLPLHSGQVQLKILNCYSIKSAKLEMSQVSQDRICPTPPCPLSLCSLPGSFLCIAVLSPFIIQYCYCSISYGGLISGGSSQYLQDRSFCRLLVV